MTATCPRCAQPIEGDSPVALVEIDGSPTPIHGRCHKRGRLERAVEILENDGQAKPAAILRRANIRVQEDDDGAFPPRLEATVIVETQADHDWLLTHQAEIQDKVLAALDLDGFNLHVKPGPSASA